MHKNKKNLIFIIILLVVLVAPQIVSAQENRYFCRWYGEEPSDGGAPCRNTASDTCLDGYDAGSCEQYDVQEECMRDSHVCVQHPLNVDYPPIPTPTGVIDLNDEVRNDKITIAAIITVVYSASLWIAGILAFLALLFAGINYIISGANPGQRKRAMERFKNVLWGAAIILAGTVFLNIINPQLITIQDPIANNVNPSEKEYNFLGFTFETDAPQDLFDLCSTFTGTTSLTTSGAPGCIWNSGVIQEEVDEWCAWCEDTVEGTCSQDPNQENLYRCGLSGTSPDDEPAPGLPDRWAEEMDQVCMDACGPLSATGESVNSSTCTYATDGYPDDPALEASCPEDFDAACDSYGSSTELRHAEDGIWSYATCNWVGE